MRREKSSPFINDPLPYVWAAFKNLYPGKDAVAFLGTEAEITEGFGFTDFPDDGSTPVVMVLSDLGTNEQAEILAHELAHVAAGPDDEHGEAWEAAFDAIHKEFNRLYISDMERSENNV